MKVLIYEKIIDLAHKLLNSTCILDIATLAISHLCDLLNRSSKARAWDNSRPQRANQDLQRDDGVALDVIIAA